MIKDQQIESEVYLMEPGRFQTLSGRYPKHEYGGVLHQTVSTERSGKPRNLLNFEKLGINPSKVDYVALLYTRQKRATGTISMIIRKFYKWPK